MPIQGNGMHGTTEVIRDAATKDRDAFLEELIAERNKPLPETPKPLPPTARQQSQIELEQEAGRKRVAFYEAQKKLAEEAKVKDAAPPPTEMVNVPVPRSGAYQHEKSATKGKSQAI